MVYDRALSMYDSPFWQAGLRELRNFMYYTYQLSGSLTDALSAGQDKGRRQSINISAMFQQYYSWIAFSSSNCLRAFASKTMPRPIATGVRHQHTDDSQDCVTAKNATPAEK